MEPCELYYSHPIQVRFWDTGLECYFGGIGYHDYIICGHCGKPIKIAAIIDEAERYSHMDADKAIVELEWLDVSNDILNE